MILTVLLAGMLCQQLDITRPFDEFLMKERSAAQAAEQRKQRDLALERVEFAKRFDGLVLALQAFEVEYRKTEGMAWPKKEAEEVTRAMKKLESTETWKQYNDSKRRNEIARK